MTPNLPSRSKQLFSAEGSSGPSVELNSNPHPKVRAFIDKVILCPLQDIAIPLSGFRWEYSEGNFHHWSPLFHQFDTYFKTYLSRRNDLLLSDHVNVVEDDPFPKHAVLQILTVMRIILENCHQKSSFNALEHFKLLLASTDPEVLLATLETLSALVKTHTKYLWNTKLIELGSINSCLLSMAQGWGSKEQGLGLYSCVVASEKSQEEGLLLLFPSDIHQSDGKCQSRLGSTIYFELHPQRWGEGSSSAKFATSVVIEMQDLQLHKEDALLLLKQCVDKYNVPLDQRFSLLTRIRYALAVRCPETCRLYSRICLLSFIVLVQSNCVDEELLTFFANEPEYTVDLIRIVCSEDLISESIRALAMVALRAQLEACKKSCVLILGESIVDFSEENWMALLNVLQKALLSLKSCNDLSYLAFVEACIQFYPSNHYCLSISDTWRSGMVLTLLPLLKDFDSCHFHLVCHAVRTLQKLIRFSDNAKSLLIDLGGVEFLAQRLKVEVDMVTSLGGARDSSVITTECSDDGHLDTQTRLIKALLKALGLAISAPANSSMSLNPCDSSLPSTLCLIFESIDKFGGDVYCSAVTLMSNILHSDPTCFTDLQKSRLPEAFLSSVVGGIYPSPRALTCIPRGLGAICLNNEGLMAVKNASTIHFLVDIFTCKEFIVTVNKALFPLTRAVLQHLCNMSSVRGTVVDTIIEIVNKIASFGESGSFVGNGSLDSLAKAKRNMIMDMDSGEQGNDASSSQVSKDDSAVEGTTDEQFIHSSIFHVIVLIKITMEDSETCRLFVEKSGVDALLKLLIQPSIIQSSKGMGIALCSTDVFKGFTKNYPVPLARAFCSALREHLQNALTGINKVSGTFLLDPKTNPDLVVFPSLFLVEFLLFLAASKDSQWASVLLTELSGDGIDVVQGLGCVHKEILWQIALLEDAQSNVPDGKSISPSESWLLAYVTIASDRQILWKRRMYESTESEFSHLLNQYRELGQSGGIKQLHRYDNVAESLSFLIVHMFKELGKAVLLTSHCQDDTLDVFPNSKRVVLTFADIALEHVNFVGHTSPSGLETSVSIKGRYLGKVIDFIDDILMVRPYICNPILLNCLYGIGFIQTLLTAFQATSQLLFAVNRSTASQLEHSWIYGPSASFVKLMENLVTSSSILSPFTNHLLVQSISDGRVLHSMVLKYVLPIWTHPQWVGFDYAVIAPINSIISHVYCGGEVKKVGGSTSACLAASPANESTVVEMGTALKLVAANFLELAKDLLLSPSDEAREDDELASALAMSLRISGSDSKEDADVTHLFEDEMSQLPPIDQLLSTCVKLLQAKESLAFPVRGLLMVMCSQNYGQNLSNIIAFIIDQMRHSCSVSDEGKNKALFALFHILALMLHENPTLRNIALKNGLVEFASNLLRDWNAGRYDEDNTQEPKWIAAAFLVVDQLLQVDKKPNHETLELLKKNTDKIQQTPITIDESTQKCLIQLACSCIKKQLTSATLHAVLQLSATLTRNHNSAVSFIDFGGLTLLLSLPASSLFSGFDNVAASTIRHLLEDPQTFQQAMESVIKHIVMTATNRHSNGRLTPHYFLSKLTSVLSRDPVVFMQAAKSVCQVEMVRDKPYIMLLKNDDKDKEKDTPVKEDKAQIVDGNTAAGNLVSAIQKVGHGKPLDCFFSVVEHLLNLVIAFEPSLEVNTDTNGVSDLQTVSDMDMYNAANKGKGKVVSSASECTKSNNQDSDSLAKVVFILKLLTEILVTYSASVHVLLWMDAGVRSCKPPLRQGHTRYSCSRIFNHILHKFVVHSRNLNKEQILESDLWMYKLATRASKFLVVSCLCSGEARKRIFTEINSVFHEFVEAADGVRCPGHDLQTFIDLLNDALGSHHLTGLCTSAEAADTFIDAGLVRSLTQTLQVLDLDHPESSNLVIGLVKALEIATKQYMADIGKADSYIKASGGHGNFVEEDEEHHVEDDVDQEDYEIDEDGFYDLEDNFFEVFGTDNSFPPHPMLVEQPRFLFSTSSRVSDNFHTLEYYLVALSESVETNRNIDNTSLHLDTIFGSLRTRSQGYIQASGKSGLPVVTQELEVFLVSYLAQQQAQRLHQSRELEGKLMEMDGASIISTFPSDQREEVHLTSSDSVLANLTPALVAEENMLHKRSIGGKLPPGKRSPLVDADALKGMIRLLQVFQVSNEGDPLKLPYEGHLQRLLLNLCAHNETRTELVQMLMGMLLDTQKAGNQLTASEPSYQLYACHSYAMYSLPHFFEGVPPFVSRRVLETMTYLAYNCPSVAKIMLEFRLPQQSHQAFQSFDDQHVGARMPENYCNVMKGKEQESKPSIALLLGLLNLPLYLRSRAHLQQLLKLLDVLINNVESKSNSLDGSGPSISDEHSASQVSTTDTEMNNSVATVSSQLDEAHKSDESAKSSIGGYEAQNMLHNLPLEELRLLCALLAKEGLSDAEYTVVANLLKKLATFSATHSHVFITELANLLQKLTKAAMEKLHECSDPEKLLLPSCSNGASILRVLQVLSSLVASLREHDADAAFSKARDIIVVVERLWSELISWIEKVEGYSHPAADPDSSRAYTFKVSKPMPAFPVGTQAILPYIEFFFVSCEKICPGQSDGSQDYSAGAIPDIDDACSLIRKQSRGHLSKINEKNSMFVKFSERHHKLLNAFMRQNPGLLDKSFSLMLTVPHFIDFDIKRIHFRSKMKHQLDCVKILVQRDSILEDSYNQLRSLSTKKLKGLLNVHFLGEEGIDAGGLTREWYQLLSRAIVDKRALLFTTVGNDSTFQPDPNSVCKTEHLSYFKFVGRVVGKALFDGELVDVHFTRSFYKHMLGAKVTYHDIEAIDPDYYKNLKWMLENDISEVLHLTFSREADEKLISNERTGVTDYELIPGGRSIQVTEENKHQYVDLVAEHRLTTAIQPQINAFLEGFRELVPRELISIFNVKELELLISGLPNVDVDDMRANTEYHGYTAGDPVIKWFWEVVKGFNKEERACLLQFVTGTSKVPLEGFGAIPGSSGTHKLKIAKAYESIDHLPTAHTCFNQIDLPNYPSKERLRERLLLAIHEGKEGFGFC